MIRRHDMGRKKKKEKKAEEKLAMILLACMYIPVVVIGLAARAVSVRNGFKK